MKFFRRRTFRTTLQTSAVSIQPLERVSTSANNWGGASQTVVELIKDLDVELSQLDTDDLREQKDATKARLRERAEVFSNSRIDYQKHSTWICSLSVARLSSVAAICAQSVYQPLIPPQDPSYSIKVLFSIGASVSGDVKATTLYLVQSLGNTSDGSESRSILVVSVRGSAGLVDWIVNTNTHEEDALKIIDAQVIGRSQTPNPPVHAHRGFLLAGKELIPRLVPAIKTALSQIDGPTDLLFTGHSAGGAVATILYGHFLSHLTTKYEFMNSFKVKLSCITFGAPPIFTRDINTEIQKYIKDTQRHGLALAFVTEGDPIPRMDKQYAQVIFRLLLQDSTDAKSLSESCDTDLPSKGTLLPLEACSLHRIGDIIIMSDANSNSDGALDLKLNNLGKEEFDAFLMTNFFAHKMFIYRDLITEMISEKFNKT